MSSFRKKIECTAQARACSGANHRTPKQDLMLTVQLAPSAFPPRVRDTHPVLSTSPKDKLPSPRDDQQLHLQATKALAPTGLQPVRGESAERREKRLF